ncbi:NPCBM/NEW2 domain-containing protein [Aeoliella sp. SH292]|uniref:NPCBM/NEW2 domain-containing protein n=1 Tax=Aeoliella sp. SH292 TaxID=3454464 RepID=UPI003F988440
MYSLLLLFAVALSAAAEVRVITVDEQALAGEIDSLDARTLALATANEKPELLPIDRVLRIETTRPATAATSVPRGEVLFVDGTRISVSDFATEGAEAILLGTTLTSSGNASINVKLDQVRAVRMMPLEPSVPTLEIEWKDLLAGDAAGDLIVIRKAGAANLNFVEGTLGDARAAAVSFTLDGETMEVNRNKVFGVLYFRQTARNSSPTAAVITGAGFRILASTISYSDGQFVVDNVALGRITLPATAIDTIDYSMDRLQYLSDLDPVRHTWSPSPTEAIAKSMLGSVVRDRAFYAPDLSLEYPYASLTEEEASSAGLAEIKVFKKGLAIRSRTEVVYRVPAGFESFRATAGIDPRTRATGNVVLTLVGDGQTLVEQPIRGQDAPVELECNVAGIKQLGIVVDFGDAKSWNRGTGDNLHLGGARFIKQ